MGEGCQDNCGWGAVLESWWVVSGQGEGKTEESFPAEKGEGRHPDGGRVPVGEETPLRGGVRLMGEGRLTGGGRQMGVGKQKDVGSLPGEETPDWLSWVGKG